MKLDRIRLDQFKCFTDVDLRLDSGVTVIHGLNGSGKSSLLEAAFFALYGARALPQTLESVVTIGAEEATVELWFTHDGQSYHVRRRLRVRDSGTQTVECVLEMPGETIEGSKDVRREIAELLRMDHEAFLNCAYVRQGEVNKLIDAAPAQRQDMLDDLLQLGKLELYRDRASDARVGVGRVRDDTQGALTQVRDQITTKEDKDLTGALNQAETELAEVNEERERMEANREEATDALDEAESILETYEEKREELTAVEDDIEALRERIETTEGEREELAEEIQQLRDDREEAATKREQLLAQTAIDTATEADIRARRQALREERETVSERINELVADKQRFHSRAQSRRERADTLAERATEKREEAAQLDVEVENGRKDLADRRNDLAEMAARIDEIEDQFADAPVSVGEAGTWESEVTEELSELRATISELETRVEAEQAALADARALVAAGKCPECGQDVESAPHVDSIDEDKQRVATLKAELAEREDERSSLEETLETAEKFEGLETEYGELVTRRSDIESLVSERERSLEEKAERAEELRGSASKLDADADEERAAGERLAARAERLQAAIGTENARLSTLKERLERLETLSDVTDRIETLESDIARRDERRGELADRVADHRERVASLRERKSELKSDLDESSLQSAREERTRAADYLEAVEAELEELDERRSELRETIGALRNELTELQSLRERRDDLETQLSNLNSLYEEVADLQEMYGQLRTELRQRNVDVLERMLNETFDLVYQNDSYSHIELDGEYRLTVYQKDGDPLEPEQLSGGERALFNLSLRAAIYRLLAEGIEGGAPMPPLILDEPTVYLDAGHVSRLVALVEHMRDLGVEQILLVSHDEELVGAADDLVTVQKDATTNRSSVERSAGPEVAAHADD